jgi:hypothetical protein
MSAETLHQIEKIKLNRKNLAVAHFIDVVSLRCMGECSLFV